MTRARRRANELIPGDTVSGGSPRGVLGKHEGDRQQVLAVGGAIAGERQLDRLLLLRIDVKPAQRAGCHFFTVLAELPVGFERIQVREEVRLPMRTRPAADRPVRP